MFNLSCFGLTAFVAEIEARIRDRFILQRTIQYQLAEALILKGQLYCIIIDFQSILISVSWRYWFSNIATRQKNDD